MKIFEYPGWSIIIDSDLIKNNTYLMPTDLTFGVKRIIIITFVIIDKIYYWLYFQANKLELMSSEQFDQEHIKLPPELLAQDVRADSEYYKTKIKRKKEK